jgi:hypothetical protein
MLRIPHCLDSRIIDGGKVVSLKLPPHFTPQKHYYFNVNYSRPPLWSSGQSFWLQIRRPGFDFRQYQKKKKGVVGLERGPLSLVSTIEELLDRKVAAPV